MPLGAIVTSRDCFFYLFSLSEPEPTPAALATKISGRTADFRSAAGPLRPTRLARAAAEREIAWNVILIKNASL
jgi:hypothetical protein